MSGLWVSVTAEYDGSTFAHRVEWGGPVPRNPVHTFNLAADEAVGYVRGALAGRTGPKNTFMPDGPLSEHEKLRQIQNILATYEYRNSEPLNKIAEVLKR